MFSVSNSFQSDHVPAIFGSHVTHITSCKICDRFLAYNLSKNEQNWFKFKESVAAEVKVLPPNDEFWT